MKKISKKIVLGIGVSLFSIAAFAGEPDVKSETNQTITPIKLEKYATILKAVERYEKEHKQENKPTRNYREIKPKEQVKQLQLK